MKTDRAATRAVIVITSAPRLSSALERDLAELGRTTVLVATPLEAVSKLEDRGIRFDTAIVTFEPGGADQLDILEYLIDHHVDVRRILVAEESCHEAVAEGRVHAVLPKPWHPRNLRHVLRREELDS